MILMHWRQPWQHESMTLPSQLTWPMVKYVRAQPALKMVEPRNMLAYNMKMVEPTTNSFPSFKIPISLLFPSQTFFAQFLLWNCNPYDHSCPSVGNGRFRWLVGPSVCRLDQWPRGGEIAKRETQQNLFHVFFTNCLGLRLENLFHLTYC